MTGAESQVDWPSMTQVDLCWPSMTRPVTRRLLTRHSYATAGVVRVKQFQADRNHIMSGLLLWQHIANKLADEIYTQNFTDTFDDII